MKSNHTQQILCSLITALSFAGTGLFPATANASDVLEKAVVVFELYLNDAETLEKTPDYTEALVKELDESPYVAVLSRADGEKLLAGRSLKAKGASEAQYSEREAALNEAINAVLNGDSNAVELLTRSIDELTQLFSQVAVDEKLYSLFLKNHMLLAQAYLDQGNEEQLSSILEKVMRHFGPTAIKEDETHPSIVKEWRSIGAKLEPERTAELVISSTPPGADVFIQGKKLEEQTPVTLSKLIPGELIIQLQKGKDRSVAHMVKTESGKSSSLAVDLAFERALRISGDRFGLAFENQKDFEDNGAKFASRLGKLLDVDKVVLVALRSDGDQASFVGATVDVGTQTLQQQVQVPARANVVVRSRVRDLAWLLIRNDLNAAGDTRPWFENTWGWVAAGVGVTGIIVGAITRADYDERLQAIQEDCAKYPCEVAGEPVTNRDQLIAAADSAMLIEGVSNTSFILGGLSLIGSVLLFTLDTGTQGVDKESALPTLQSFGPTFLHDGSTGMGASWSF